ncbi:MAG TPA: hypothetical protein DCG12_09305 [Planctomycetaceae bacterium]|nr:hypothetical protein [Planctomycetaceae bacterium]
MNRDFSGFRGLSRAPVTHVNSECIDGLTQYSLLGETRVEEGRELHEADSYLKENCCPGSVRFPPAP